MADRVTLILRLTVALAFVVVAVSLTGLLYKVSRGRCVDYWVVSVFATMSFLLAQIEVTLQSYVIRLLLKQQKGNGDANRLM